MFRFADPQYLYLLLLLPALLLAYIGSEVRARRRLRRFGESALVSALVEDASPKRRAWKFAAVALGLALCCLTLARPQYGTARSSEKHSGIEVAFMLDVSNSMLATDVQPSRLESAKLLISQITAQMTDDRLALGIFAGEAYPVLPITADYASLPLFLDPVTPASVNVQGTQLAAAIRLAAASFSQRKEVGRAIVLITDGEDHEPGAAEAAAEAARAGMPVYVLGVGSAGGAKIPQGDGTFLTDAGGAEVVTTLNEAMCREIATAGKGTFIRVESAGAAGRALQAALSTLKRGESQVDYTARGELFQWLALLAFIVLSAELFVRETKSPLIKRLHLFRPRAARAAAPLLLLALLAAGGAAPLAAQTQDYAAIHAGNRHFRAKQYDRAAAAYARALKANPANGRARYNLGDVRLAQNQPDEALRLLQEAIDKDTSPTLRAMAYHNRGVIYQHQAGAAPNDEERQKLLRRAIDEYKQALRNNQHSDPSRYNLALCQKQLRDSTQQPKPKPQPKPQPKPEPQPKPQDQQQNNPLMNYARQAEQRTRKKINARPQQRTLDKNW